MSAPSMTFNAEGNVRASGSLAASANATYDLDFSALFEGQVTIENTPGGTVATTRGLKVEFLPGFGTTPSYATIPELPYTLPSATASTLESKTFYLPTGKYRLRITNLDASNAVTVRITSSTIDSVA